MSAEDGLADTIRPRLDAAGADPANVIAWETVTIFDEDGLQTGSRPPSLPRDIGRLEEIIEAHGAVLVVVDVLNAFLGADVDGHRDQDIRRALTPLKLVAERTGCAILAIRHLNKGSGPAMYRGGGSIGIAGAARSILLAATDPSDETGNRRVLAVTGNNLAAPATSLAYSLVSEHTHGCARVEWHGVSEHTSDTLLAVQATDEDRSAVREAEDFLRDVLSAGPHPAKEVEKAAREAGVQPRTLRRAKDRLGIKSRKLGFDSSWSWVLPEADRDRPPEVAILAILDMTRRFLPPKVANSPKAAKLRTRVASRRRPSEATSRARTEPCLDQRIEDIMIDGRRHGRPIGPRAQAPVRRRNGAGWEGLQRLCDGCSIDYAREWHRTSSGGWVCDQCWRRR